MEFQPLPNIGLKTSPNVECQAIEETQGIKVPVPPIKLVITEGNKRVCKQSADPSLLKAIKHLEPPESCSGVYFFQPYNFFALRSLNPPEFFKEVACHENGHAFYNQIRALVGLTPTEELKKAELQSLILGADAVKETRAAGYLFREGFAEWIALATKLKLKRLSDEDIATTHLKNILTRLRISGSRGTDFKTNPNLYYDHGHKLVFFVMAFLTRKCRLTPSEALKEIALHPPTTLTQVRETYPVSYLRSLNLTEKVPDLEEIEERFKIMEDCSRLYQNK